EAVKQRLLHYRPLAHHQTISRFGRNIESEHHDNFKREFFNTIHPKRSLNEKRCPTASHS
ncbi:MAG: hypothetical protein M3Q88_03220, partial [Pseudomonadota bacterium]|nr:hypothetical protein [Pseudomonadota bacterium]